MHCCCTEEPVTGGTRGCGCREAGRQGQWLSKKKQAEALAEQLRRLESKAEDIREYLKELAK